MNYLKITIQIKTCDCTFSLRFHLNLYLKSKIAFANCCSQEKLISFLLSSNNYESLK